MMDILKSEERGHANHGWLDSYFTFSFADFFDPEHVQFRTLRVMNDDRIAGGGGFPKHLHRDMEIVTYVLEGALEHKDSMGNGSVLKPGDVQYMSAGTGVAHSEFNASKTEPVHLYQIWMLPEKQGLRPTYDQKNFSEADKRGKLRLVASPDGRDGSVKIRQDNELYATVLGAGRNSEACAEERPARLHSSGTRQRQAERYRVARRRRRGHFRRKSRGADGREKRRGPALRPRLRPNPTDKRVGEFFFCALCFFNFSAAAAANFTHQGNCPPAAFLSILFYRRANLLSAMGALELAHEAG